MRRHLKAALAVIVASTSIVVTTTAPANAATATLSFDDGVLYSGCFDYPYSYTLDLPSGTTNWSLDLTITKPDGEEIASDYQYGTGRIGTLESDVMICGSEDAGELTAAGTVEGSGSSIRDYELDITPTTFTMRRPQSQTIAKLLGKPKCGKTVRIKSTTLDERPNGFFPAEYGDVVLQQQIGSKWKRLDDDYIDEGSATFAVRWTKPKNKPCSKATLRVMTAYDSDYREASYSEPIKLG